MDTETKRISRQATADILGVTLRTVRRYVDRGYLKQYRDPVNGRVWYDSGEVAAVAATRLDA